LDALVTGVQTCALPILPVQGRRVEKPDARLPRGFDHALRLVVRNGREQAAERRGAEAQAGDAQRRLAERSAVGRIQSWGRGWGPFAIGLVFGRGVGLSASA